MPKLPMPEGVTFPDLNAVMLDIAPLDVIGHLGDGTSPDDLFYGDTERLKYAQGAVAEKQAHLTLLFGIHPSRNYVPSVEAVLRGWKPELISIEKVDFFEPIVEGQDYKVIVGKVRKSKNLLDANARLSELNYSNQFDTWEPHITLAYIKGSADVDKWVLYLDEVYGGQTFEPVQLNYGNGTHSRNF